MSAFRPSGGSGGGIDPAQLAALVDDNEAAALAAGLLSTSDAYNLHGTVLSTVNSRADMLSDAVNNARVTILDNLPGPAYAGKIEMRLAPGGVATSGWTKLGGIGVPENFFNTVRTALLPFTVGTNGLTDGQLTTARKATLGDVVYALASGMTSGRSYNFGTSGWADLPVVPTGIYGAPTVYGTVNGKLFATGSFSGSNTTNTAWTFDLANAGWASRAPMASFRQGCGIVDMLDGTCVLFGGKDVSDSTATSATNITTTVRKFSDADNTFTDLPTPLPVRMFNVRSVRLATGTVVLFPAVTSDGTTLVSNSRRVFRWTDAGGGVELDPIPAEVGNTPYLIHPRSDGTVVYVPTATPSSGSRARLLNPSAASGSQWSGIDWDYNSGTTYSVVPAGMECKATGSGFMMTAGPALSATFVGVPQANWSQVIYQAKN